MLGKQDAELLLSKGYGYPLRSPEPSEVPADYRENGVRIGDVGVLTGTGSFRYFFNIRLPRDDAVNSFLRDPAIKDNTMDFKVVTTTNSTMNSDPRVGSPTASNEISDSSDVDTAVPLRTGTSIQALADLQPFRKHLLDYGGVWIGFMEKLGRPEGEPLYLITGCVKSSSHAGGAPRSKGDLSEVDQCAFIRGYMIQKRAVQINSKPFGHSSPEVPSTERPPKAKRSLRRKILSLFTSCWSFSFDSTSGRSQGPVSRSQGRPRSPDAYILARPIREATGSLHPSKAIIEYLFGTAPNALFAIVHDDEWGSVLREEDSNIFPDDKQIVERVLTKYRVEVQGDYVFLATLAEVDTSRSRSSEVHTYPYGAPEDIENDGFDASWTQDMSGMLKATTSDGTGAVFALIIGNNNYLATDVYPTLMGSVNDARAFERYLLDPRAQKGLQVPPSNIHVLENATRDNIISSFKSHLLDNANIPDHGKATMILFYAGHGTRITATDNIISTDGKVEAIAPVDERKMDAAGEYVHAIPDYILGWLLWELSEKKGPNITVILDSCCSGGMGRDVGTARNGNSASLPVPLDLDSHLWEGKTETAMTHRLWTSSATSHVLLAACRHNETAREIEYDQGNTLVHGRFTKELITSLRRLPLENTTYSELLKHMPVWSGQTPHCGGCKKNQLVFSGNYPAAGLPLTLHYDPDARIPPSFRVDIGTVEGVVPGTEFEIRSGDSRFLCILVADSVKAGHATLVAKNKQPVTIPEGSRAVVSDWKNDAMVLHVHVPPEFPYVFDLFPTTNITYQPNRRKYVRARDLATADILVRAEGQDIVIHHLTGMMIECQPETRFSVNGNTAHLPDFLDGIAHFNYFLERHNGSDLREAVTLEMHRLVGKYPGRKPDRQFGVDGNIVVNDQVQLIAQADAKYGVTMRNMSAVDLFPYLFFFDPDEYTIKCWYSPASVHDAAPLKSNSVVTVGMGSERAFEFPATLPPGVSSSFAFLKLFVSMEPLDLECIQQETPFDPKFECQGRLLAAPELSAPLQWGGIKVILTLTPD